LKTGVASHGRCKTNNLKHTREAEEEGRNHEMRRRIEAGTFEIFAAGTGADRAKICRLQSGGENGEKGCWNISAEGWGARRKHLTVIMSCVCIEKTGAEMERLKVSNAEISGPGGDGILLTENVPVEAKRQCLWEFANKGTARWKSGIKRVQADGESPFEFKRGY